MSAGWTTSSDSKTPYSLVDFANFLSSFDMKRTDLYLGLLYIIFWYLKGQSNTVRLIDLQKSFGQGRSLMTQKIRFISQ